MKSGASISSIILFTSISSSALSLSYEPDYSFDRYGKYEYSQDMTEWNNISYFNSPDISSSDENYKKYRDLLVFSKFMVENTKDIDSDIVELVNNNFWDLI